MLSSIRPRQAPLRCFSTTPPSSNRIAPPHPVSHIRPIIYSDSPAPDPPRRIHHPYSLSEFIPNAPTHPLELQYKLQRQQLDDFNHTFWFDSNSRFEAAKAATLACLPSTATPLDKEHALSAFYLRWHTQEASRTFSYTTEYRRQNLALLKLAARLQYHRLFSTFSQPRKSAAV